MQSYRYAVSDTLHNYQVPNIHVQEIQQTNSSLLRTNGMYALHVESACREMIARLVPVEELYKGENYE